MKNPLVGRDLEQNRSKQNQKNRNNQEDNNSNSGCGICSVNYYKAYFNVTTEDVKTRILCTINPLSDKFSDITLNNPDLYGPFWIYTSLIFMLGVGGNFSTFLANNGNQFQYNFNFVPMAAGIVYGFGLVVPVLIAFIMRQFNSNASYFHVICTYGYSMFTFIPISFFCSVPSSSLQWICMIYGIANSSLFLYNNLARDIQAFDKNKRHILMIFVAATQIALLLTYRLYFFSSIYVAPTQTTAS